MARLRKLGSEEEWPLPSRLLIGRSGSCGLRLASAVASGEHATISWTGDHWEIRDLGSRNGTLVDRTRLEPGRPIRLSQGARLMFGAPDETWEVVDEDPPGATAVELSGARLESAKGGLLALPSEADPRVSIYKDAGGAWVVEGPEGEVRPVRDQEVISLDGRSWRLHLPLEAEGTPMIEPGPTLANIRFRFGVSKNEELVDIVIQHGNRSIPLEAREHGYVLLTLARARRADSELSVGERGWLDRDELLRMLSLDSNGLNVAIHRARQQLLAVGIEGAQGIVEVRRGHRRFGTDRFEITAI
ncbi:MAG: FHA domain-containing protein [Myxococcota bacterium]